MKYPPLVHVTSVESLGGFVLRLTFDDGATIERDLTEYLRGGVFKPLRDDPELFKQARVEGGTLVWPNGADMDPVVLRGFAEPAWKEDETATQSG
ncbi:MAG TPA: DUF2442 domain-containing protein [Fimbriimonadaceae bacterium]|nr:DUF2442 domain-containing protein [Fimbriimonadaceae bacterium]HVM35416.1 DUF2442 domain-containing protein [Actinomycetota bacterium]